MSWFGTRGTVLIKGYGFRSSSGSLAIFAAIRRVLANLFLPTDRHLMPALFISWREQNTPTLKRWNKEL
jgi:hypothetical protein